MAGLKDWIDPVTGGYYQAILETQIQAGSIKISGDTYFTPGYDPSKKAKTWTDQPTPPYYVGDTWIADETIYCCITTRETGTFNAADWTDTILRRIGATNISDGKLYLSSVWEDGNYRLVTASEKAAWEAKNRTFRQSYPPSSPQKGDLWYDTGDNDKLYRWSGSSWQRQYTEIDGGHIETGTIDCEKVTISAGAGGVILDTNGVSIYGDNLNLYQGTTLRGSIYGSDASFGLYIGASDMLSLTAGSNIQFMGYGLWFNDSDYLDLPRRSSDPIAYEGRTYYNTTTYLWRCYTDGSWRTVP